MALPRFAAQGVDGFSVMGEAAWQRSNVELPLLLGVLFLVVGRFWLLVVADDEYSLLCPAIGCN